MKKLFIIALLSLSTQVFADQFGFCPQQINCKANKCEMVDNTNMSFYLVQGGVNPQDIVPDKTLNLTKVIYTRGGGKLDIISCEYGYPQQEGNFTHLKSVNFANQPHHHLLPAQGAQKDEWQKVTDEYFICDPAKGFLCKFFIYY